MGVAQLDILPAFGHAAAGLEPPVCKLNSHLTSILADGLVVLQVEVVNNDGLMAIRDDAGTSAAAPASGRSHIVICLSDCTMQGDCGS